MAQKWEYAVVQEQGNKLMEEMNSMGKRGWEAISITQPTGTIQYVVIMKREMVEEEKYDPPYLRYRDDGGTDGG